jgi:predicted phosphohydrolase
VDVPPGDILIHAGDIGFFSRQSSVYRDFTDWLRGLFHCHKILVPGNHDYLLPPTGPELIPNAHVLIGKGIVIDHLQLWGSRMIERTQRRWLPWRITLTLMP